MKPKLVNLENAGMLSTTVELTPEEERELIAQYKALRTVDALDADYRDLDTQVADGVPAEQLIKELNAQLQAE